MPFGIGRRYRHMKRYRQIGEVLLRHGFGFLLQQSGLSLLLPPFKRYKVRREKQDSALSLGARLRLTLDQLGPTFVKFGQLISTRPDIVPPEIFKELEDLQDNVAPISFEQIKTHLETTLGRPIEELFSDFSTQPLAAASIGQVHRATLLDGTKVVVKVRRPGIEAMIATDLEIMYSFAQNLAARYDNQLIDFVELVDHFSKSIRRELDYTREGRNIDRFRQKFSDNPDVIIPEVYWDYSNDSVLTMNYIEGIKLRDIDKIKATNIDLTKLAHITVDALIEQVFQHGIFHGDPHPGNLLVTEDGKLVFLDFGNVGRIDPLTMNSLAKLMVAITKRDIDGILKVMQDLGALSEQPTREMYLDIAEIIDDYYDRKLKELNFSQIAEDILYFVRSYPVRMPPELTLLVKALVTVEGVGSRLVPDFNVMASLEPFAKKWIKEHYSLKQITEAGFDWASTWIKTSAQLPLKLDTALDTVNRGDLEIQFHHRGLERFINRLDIIANRLTAALIVASLIVGSSFVMLIDRGPRISNVPLIGLLGFLLAGMIGVWLLVSILRSGRY